MSTTALAGVGFTAARSDAAIYRYLVEGPVFLAPDSGDVGDPMYLRFTVDSDSIVSISATGREVPIIDFEYGIPGTSEVFKGTGGTLSFSLDFAFRAYFSDGTGASYDTIGSFTPEVASIDVGANPITNTLITSYVEGLPATFNLSLWNTGNGFYAYDGDAFRLRMNYQNGVTITLSAIPEPASAAMLGLGALATLRRKRRREAVA